MRIDQVDLVGRHAAPLEGHPHGPRRARALLDRLEGNEADDPVLLAPGLRNPRCPCGADRLRLTNRTSVRARPTGVERADAINIRIPIEGAGALTVGEIA
jgi:hypothetical protein